MRNTTNILGIPVDNVTLDEAMEKIESFLNQNELRMVFTPNSEIMMAAQRDSELKNILCNADLLVPDGAGVVLASKILGSPLKERVAGFDLTNRLLDHAKQSQIGFFLFGGKPGIADEAAKNLLDENASIKILGIRHGYFTQNEETDIIQEINSSGADVLLVALGAPKQEKWIHKNRKKLNIKVCIGVGGSLDVLAKRVSLAPAFFRNNGLEWLYRLCKEPWRFKRMLDLPRFILLVIAKKMGFFKNL
ncbi:MAG: WecB/TagA/CpsF family glycosyltransferase [Clostridium sp.]|nr:WecB/TagA/CpsF family glycosyltransferase [Clostridium sp.]